MSADWLFLFFLRSTAEGWICSGSTYGKRPYWCKMNLFLRCGETILTMALGSWKCQRKRCPGRLKNAACGVTSWQSAGGEWTAVHGCWMNRTEKSRLAEDCHARIDHESDELMGDATPGKMLHNWKSHEKCQLNSFYLIWWYPSLNMLIKGKGSNFGENQRAIWCKTQFCFGASPCMIHQGSSCIW